MPTPVLVEEGGRGRGKGVMKGKGEGGGRNEGEGGGGGGGKKEVRGWKPTPVLVEGSPTCNSSDGGGEERAGGHGYMLLVHVLT